MSTILFIDGENFRKKVKEILQDERIVKKEEEPEWARFNFKGLFDQILEGVKVDKKIFYFAKINKHPSTVKKSEELIERNRLLKTHLESEAQEFNVILAGNVRGYPAKKILRIKKAPFFKVREVIVFKEKGVDVRIAVDMVAMSCDNILDTAILVSSDSDLQPAIKELRGRKKTCIYIGFENNQNKGLFYTTNKTVLIRNSEIIKFYQKSLI